MSDIQRWDVDERGSMFESDDGPLVFHADVQAWVQRELDAAVERVKALYDAEWQSPQRRAAVIAAIKARPVDE